MLFFMTSLAFYSHLPVLYWNGKRVSVWGSMLPKIGIIREKVLNKSCWALNFIQKSSWAHMSIPIQSRANGLEKLMWWKDYNVQKWQITITLGLNASKNTAYIEKDSKSCLELNSLQESQWAHMSISHWSKATGLKNLIWLKYYNVQNWQITFTSGLNAAKNNAYVEKGSSKSCLELNSLQKKSVDSYVYLPLEWS